jgi:hypothetical protein
MHGLARELRGASRVPPVKAYMASYRIIRQIWPLPLPCTCFPIHPIIRRWHSEMLRALKWRILSPCRRVEVCYRGTLPQTLDLEANGQLRAPTSLLPVLIRIWPQCCHPHDPVSIRKHALKWATVATFPRCVRVRNPHLLQLFTWPVSSEPAPPPQGTVPLSADAHSKLH